MNQIRDIRQARGMTQKELADRLGVNQSMISDYESGKVDLSLTKAVKIADILECELYDLLGRTDNPAPVTA